MSGCTQIRNSRREIRNKFEARNSSTKQNRTLPLPLVPKLRLGTHASKLRFASCARPAVDAKRSLEDMRSQTEFGNEVGNEVAMSLVNHLWASSDTVRS